MTTRIVRSKIGAIYHLSIMLIRYRLMVARVYLQYWAGLALNYLSNIRNCQRNGRSLEAYKRGLENIIAAIRRYDDDLNDEAHGGEHPIPPGADDYNEITVKMTVLAESALKEATDRKIKRFRIIHKEAKP